MALQVVVSVVIAFVLVAGPQVEPLWDRVNQVWNRPQPPVDRPPIEAKKLGSPAKAPQPPLARAPASQNQAQGALPAPAAPPAAAPEPAPAAHVQPQPKPVATIRQRPKAKLAPAATSRAVYAPVLIEPKADPKISFSTLMQEGYELYRSGWYGPAMGRFKLAAQIRSNSVTAYLWMGRAGLKAGRTAEGRRALEQVISMAPGSEAAREARALLGTFE